MIDTVILTFSDIVHTMNTLLFECYEYKKVLGQFLLCLFKIKHYVKVHQIKPLSNECHIRKFPVFRMLWHSILCYSRVQIVTTLALELQ